MNILQIIESSKTWSSKKESIILVTSEEEKQKLLEALIAQDDYWESYQDVVQVYKEGMNIYHNLEYCGKTDIYDIKELRSQLGFDFFIYQNFED